MRTFEEIQDEYHALCHMPVESRGEEIAKDAARFTLEWVMGNNVYPMSEQIKMDLFFGKLEDPGWNVRKSGPELDSHIRWLADSIKEKGVQEPLTIWMNGEIPTVTNGHCRLLAVKLAKKEGAEIKSVPVRVEERYASEGDRILSMITRNSGRPLSSLELSEVIRRLIAYGWTVAEVAKKTGYSSGQVNNMLTLSGLGPELTKPIEKGQVSSTLVVAEVRKKGPAEATKSIVGAIERAQGEGKQRATRKHMPREVGINWGHWGPILLKALQEICETPIQKVGPTIASARELIEKMEEK